MAILSCIFFCSNKKCLTCQLLLGVYSLNITLTLLLLVMCKMILVVTNDRKQSANQSQFWECGNMSERQGCRKGRGQDRERVEKSLNGWPHKKNRCTNVKEWTGRPVEDLLTISQDKRGWQHCQLPRLSMCSLPQPTVPAKETNDWLVPPQFLFPLY